MNGFPRLLTAMITPFKDDFSVDFMGAQKLALQLIEEGNEGFVISGTTGEAPSLSKKEKLDLFKAIKEAVGSKAWIFAGTGSNSTLDTARFTEEAARTGVDGIMLVTPYYNKPSQEGLYQHFKTVADTVNLPIILYNVPGRTGINLLPDTVVKLAALPNIVALKEACGNLDQVSALQTKLPEDFYVLSGDDSLTLPMLAVGCYGIISVAAHLVGRQMREMIEAYVAGDVKKACQIHVRLYSLFKALFITSNPVPVKKALALVGRPAGKLRLPLVEASAAETQVISEAMQKVGLL
ncbi:MAG TPA: 4-hydroxy-tetrahydrodipicolinate synthase [Clostridia bacterium]|jgi:4-hydroxy-tetrahydrodipicolinate synthase|nr:4-hydroxy-tetrahydrodipicolinate synthase [Clostridia bacterium]HHY05398.1 4-hydroxy-tetrahydrodipicolinate synthase [Clostridia bacterium]